MQLDLRGTGSRVGLGLRPQLAADLLAAPETVDLVEVIAERCLQSRRALREARALRVGRLEVHCCCAGQQFFHRKVPGSGNMSCPNC